MIADDTKNVTAKAAPKSLPPFPTEKHWLFGSAYLLKDRSFDQISFFIKKYGDIFSLSLPFANVVVISNPDFARYVLVDNNRNYRKSMAYDVLKVLLGNGLLTSEGEFWKKQRRLIQPAFHKKKLEELTIMMVDRAQLAVDKFKSFAGTGKPHDFAPEMTALTLDIISKAIFSSGVEQKAHMVGEQIKLLNQMAIDKINQPFRLPAFIPTPFNVRESKAVKALDSVIYEIIDRRRQEGVSKDDLLSMLIDTRDEETGEAMDNRQLRDEIMTIFIAGNETSSNALAWTLYLLANNPEKEAKMVAEIEEKLSTGQPLTFGFINSFQYVKMVIEESMRIFPPAWSIGRRNIGADEIGGYRVRPNTNVLIPIMHFHRNPKYWEQPDSFIPERFSPENKGKIDRYVYFPFGGGPRLCIGNNFALMEMQIILILLYHNFKFKLPAGFKAEMEALVTLRPREGMPLLIEKRQEK